MANPVPMKGFLQLSPEAAMWFALQVCPPTSPCLALSAGAEPNSHAMTLLKVSSPSLKLHDAYMHLSRIFGNNSESMHVTQTWCRFVTQTMPIF